MSECEFKEFCESIWTRYAICPISQPDKLDICSIRRFAIFVHNATIDKILELDYEPSLQIGMKDLAIRIRELKMEENP